MPMMVPAGAADMFLYLNLTEVRKSLCHPKASLPLRCASQGCRTLCTLTSCREEAAVVASDISRFSNLFESASTLMSEERLNIQRRDGICCAHSKACWKAVQIIDCPSSSHPSGTTSHSNLWQPPKRNGNTLEMLVVISCRLASGKAQEWALYQKRMDETLWNATPQSSTKIVWNRNM